MSNPNEDVARIIREHTDRIDRLEDERYQEGVPNPSREVEETATTDEQVSVESQPAGNMQWGDSWGINEYQ